MNIMRILMFTILILVIVSCATMEQQCDQEVASGRWDSYQACVTFKQEQNRQQGQAFQNLGNTLRPQSTGSKGPQGVDGQCLNNCLAQGYSGPLCNSKCSY